MAHTPIPDEAVQAAWDIIQDRDDFEDMRDALKAALPYLTNPHDEFGCPPSDEENEHLQEAWDRIRELEDGIWEAIGCMWENQIGVCYVEAGQRHALLALLHKEDTHE